MSQKKGCQPTRLDTVLEILKRLKEVRGSTIRKVCYQIGKSSGVFCKTRNKMRNIDLDVRRAVKFGVENGLLTKGKYGRYKVVEVKAFKPNVKKDKIPSPSRELSTSTSSSRSAHSATTAFISSSDSESQSSKSKKRSTSRKSSKRKIKRLNCDGRRERDCSDESHCSDDSPSHCRISERQVTFESKSLRECSPVQDEAGPSTSSQWQKFRRQIDHEEGNSNNADVIIGCSNKDCLCNLIQEQEDDKPTEDKSVNYIT